MSPFRPRWSTASCRPRPRPTSTRSAGRLGVEDRACVVGEPFRQWVIEDEFRGQRPPWDLAGAEFVRRRRGARTHQDAGPERRTDVALHARRADRARLHLRGRPPSGAGRLRPPHAGRRDRLHPPARAGHGARNPISTSRCRACATRRSATATTRSPPTVRRRSCSACSTRCATASGRARPFDRLACAVAGFIAYLAKASPRARRATWEPSDPFAGTVRDIADATGPDPAGLVRRIMGLTAIFGPDLPANPQVVAGIERHLDGLLSPDPEGYLRGLGRGAR